MAKCINCGEQVPYNKQREAAGADAFCASCRRDFQKLNRKLGKLAVKVWDKHSNNPKNK